MGRIPPNVLKLRKQKRKGRRAYLNQGKIYVPRSVGKSFIPEDSKPLFDYRERVKSYAIPFLERIFPSMKGEERRFALERAEEEKLIASVEDPDVCDCYTVAQGGITKTRLTLVYNLRKTRLYFIEVAYREGASYMMKSIVYGAEDRALFAYHHKQINWLECIPLASLELVLPRRG